jgi:hypothetical protein
MIAGTRTEVGAQTAQELADAYLIDNVGDLLMAGTPSLSEDGCWMMGIILGNARRGELGEVGTIRVDAQTGAILFTDDDCRRVKARAEALACAPAP